MNNNAESKRKAIEQMTSLFGCKKVFNTNNELTIKGQSIMPKITKLLEIAFILSRENIDKSYKAYHAICHIVHNKNRNITPIINADFDVISQNPNFFMLKNKLTAFELRNLNTQAKAHQEHKCTCHDKNKRCKYYNYLHDSMTRGDINILINYAQNITNCYDCDDLFKELDCSNPFLIKPKTINKQTDDEHKEYLSSHGTKAYNKLTKLITYAHEAFDYPYIMDKLDVIINSDFI